MHGPSPRVAETPSQRISPFPPPPARTSSLLQSPFPYSAHHHLLSRSGAIPKAANDFSLINGFLRLSSLPLPPQKTKQRKKPFPSPLRTTPLGAVYYFYCISRHNIYNLISLSMRCQEPRKSKRSEVKGEGLGRTWKKWPLPPSPHQALPKMERSSDCWRRYFRAATNTSLCAFRGSEKALLREEGGMGGGWRWF